MPIIHNWSAVKQGIIDEISIHAKSFKSQAFTDIKTRIDAKGITSTIGKNGVESTPRTMSEYNTGKNYFDEVFKDIDNQSWVDSI